MANSAGPFGGGGGTAFDTQAFFPPKYRILQLNLRSARYIDSIQCVYEPDKSVEGSTGDVKQTPSYGGGGGNPGTIALDNGEYISQVDVYSGQYVDGLIFYTTFGNKYSFGDRGGTLHSCQAPDGYSLGYVSGRSGTYLDQIMLHWTPASSNVFPIEVSPALGGTGGSEFQDIQELGVVNAATYKISRVVVRGARFIDSIQTFFKSETTGATLNTRQHGGNGGDEQVFALGDDEYITKVEVRSGTYVDGLTFYTTSGRSAKFGGDGGSLYEAKARSGFVLGWLGGRSARYLDQIQLYWVKQDTQYILEDVEYHEVTEGTPSPIAMLSAEASNPTTTTQNTTLSRQTSLATSTTYSMTNGWKVGVKTTVKTSIPFIAEGKVEFSAEFNQSFTSGSSETKTEVYTQQFQLATPPGCKMVGTALIFDGKATVQMIATFITKYKDGSTVRMPKSRGVCVQVRKVKVQTNYESTPLA